VIRQKLNKSKYKSNIHNFKINIISSNSRLADFIPRDRVFEIIQLIEANLKKENKRINKIVQILKELKASPASMVNLNLKKSFSKAVEIDLEVSLSKDNYKNYLDKDEENFIVRKIDKMTLIDANRYQSINDEDDVKTRKMKEIQENQNKSKCFYNKLYDVLNKRKSIPRQFKPIFDLELVNKNFDEAKAVNVKSMNSLNFGNKTTEVDLNKSKNDEKNSTQNILVTSPISNGKENLKIATSVPFSSTPANEKGGMFGLGQLSSNAQKSLFNEIKPFNPPQQNDINSNVVPVTNTNKLPVKTLNIFGPAKPENQSDSQKPTSMPNIIM
jgi:hypothetical protein